MDGVLLGILIGLVVAQPADPILREVVSLEVLQPALSHEQKGPTVGAGEVVLGCPAFFLVQFLPLPKAEGAAVHAVLDQVQVLWNPMFSQSSTAENLTMREY